ncbi:MAG: polymer-forming cytoskeletal protein [Candidatus Aminicenantes bacterium]|nr:polymer-forming cytoskeletal protein [Candidatus Aminicenantes bacterium]
MKERPKEIEDGRITGFFDKDTEIQGDLQFKGSFRIDGRFKGTIRSDSILIIGDQGKVEADIQIGNIIINGEVKGNIHAKERAEINSKGRVFGTISSPKLVVDEGAFLEAECHTSSKTPDAILPLKKPNPEQKD